MNNLYNKICDIILTLYTVYLPRSACKGKLLFQGRTGGCCHTSRTRYSCTAYSLGLWTRSGSERKRRTYHRSLPVCIGTSLRRYTGDCVNLYKSIYWWKYQIYSLAYRLYLYFFYGNLLLQWTERKRRHRCLFATEIKKFNIRKYSS